MASVGGLPACWCNFTPPLPATSCAPCACGCACCVCREPTLTTRTKSFSGCLDYIWLSKQHWQVASTLEMPYAEPAGAPGPPEGVAEEEFGACPNKAQPSDHLAVGCEAVLLVAPAPGVGEGVDASTDVRAGSCGKVDGLRV